MKDAALAATAARREKARLKSRRRYHQKLSTLVELRREAATLEKHMEALGDVQSSQRVAAFTIESSNRSVFSTSSDSNTARHERETLVRRTAQVTAALDGENAQLRRLLQQRNQHACRLRDLLTAEHQLRAANASSFSLIKPLTREGCDAIHTEALEVVRAFTSNHIYANLQGCISGWPITRVVERGMLHYALQKTFYRRSADFVMAQTWALFTEPSRFSTMYSDGLDVRVRLVQKVNEDNLVFFQEMAAMDPDNEHTVVKSMLLMSKLRVRRGYLILIRGLDQGRLEVEDLVEPLRPPSAETCDHVVEVWNEQFCWLHIERAGEKDENCLLSYYGITPTVGSNVYFWMVEVVLHCLRWEAATFGPRFSLPK